jgi:pimeloyl-ACP methyl ester carboxylesterase
MATVICADGLGGHPSTTFGELKNELEGLGHIVILLDVDGIKTHSERVERLITCYTQIWKQGELIYFIGQSAGGSAVRIAAEKIFSNPRLPRLLTGVCMLSPAIPRGIFFLTWTLFCRMSYRLSELLLGKMIEMGEDEYASLVLPIASDKYAEVVANRQAISGAEGRELAFYPPKLESNHFKTLHIYGTDDRWIAPSAQRKLSFWMSRNLGIPMSIFAVEGAGHLTLASNKRKEVIEKIVEWMS